MPTGNIEQGAGEPLILLHPGSCDPGIWRPTLPLLAAAHRVIALAALGHRGGRLCEQRPCRASHVVDDAERSLDALGIERAHIAGNSMGGWVALELARRGRAESVCAFSPAGMWESISDHGVVRKLRTMHALTRVTRRALPLLTQSDWLRRLLLRDTAEHGERVCARVVLELVDAMLACQVTLDLLGSPEKFEPMQANCPIDIVWSQRDRILPPEPFAHNARRLVPGARHLLLEDVGHTPMLDDPQLVARTILNTVARTHEAAQPAKF